jgi:predicted enzyme related to lactoylglutathione lyase
MTNPQARGKFVWHELITDNPKRAADFYHKVVGWTTQEMNAGMPYTVFSSHTGQQGGIMGKTPNMPANMPSAWSPYVYVPELDAAITQVKALGGSLVLGPQVVPEMGRFAVITDPQGAFLCLWEAAQEMPASPDKPPAEGDFSWYELMTTDYKAALDFYSALFGWQAGAGQDMGSIGIYQIFTLNGVPLGGMFNTIPDAPKEPPFWALYIHVSDINKTVAAVKANGGQIIHDPVEVPGGDMIAKCIDPTGALFALHQPKKA